MTINDFYPHEGPASIASFQPKGIPMRYRLNSLPLKQKIIFCLAAYSCGVALAWLMDRF
jgi:hypothetical protein